MKRLSPDTLIRVFLFITLTSALGITLYWAVVFLPAIPGALIVLMTTSALMAVLALLWDM